MYLQTHILCVTKPSYSIDIDPLYLSSQRNCALLNKYSKHLPPLVSFKVFNLCGAEILLFIASFSWKWVYNFTPCMEGTQYPAVLYSLGTNQQIQKDVLVTNLGIQRNQPQHWLNLFLMLYFGFQSWFLVNFCEFHLEFLMSIFRFQDHYLMVIFGFWPVHDIDTAGFT